MKSDSNLVRACMPPSRRCSFVGRQQGVLPLLISTLIYTCLWCSLEFLSHLTYSKGTRHSINFCTRTLLVTIVSVFICHGVKSASYSLYHRSDCSGHLTSHRRDRLIVNPLVHWCFQLIERLGLSVADSNKKKN